MEIINNTPTNRDTLRTGADKINANFAETASGNFASDLVVDKASGHGMKVDNVLPTFPWCDLRGVLYPAERWQTDVPRTDVPELSPFRGVVSKDLAFKVNDKIDRLNFHLPHDYVKGTDLFLHVHWGHNGTAISGSLVIHHYINYAKGHDQALFTAEIDIAHTILTPDIGTIPRWQHRISEIQLSTPGGAADMLDTNDLEPDGLILTALVAGVIPVITGSAAVDKPYIFEIDVHYQSTGIGTKQKAPDFYT